MLAECRLLLTESFKKRIGFVQHSFFEPQPRTEENPPATYFLHQCTHNWCKRDWDYAATARQRYCRVCARPPPRIQWIDRIILLSLGGKQGIEAEFAAFLKAK
ncbi:hypothetical protein EV127DRAFT_128570 [Xylaria flabelliformis]|nr:hypothetical protein EV127DRAFT_128570 [Xylaria flabelliformis]